MKQNRKQFIVQGLALLVIFGSLVVAYLFVDFGVISDRLRAIGFQPTDEMTELIESLGLTPRAEVILNASHPTVKDSAGFNTACGATDAEVSILGCYANDYIYIYNIENPELEGIKQSTLAHELLHAVWDRMLTAEQEALFGELDIFYTSNKDVLGPRLELYSEDNYYGELHSIIGTEYAELPDVLEGHYARYFRDQDAVTVFFDNYNAKFQELKAEADRLYAQITENQGLIDAKTTNYNDAVIELNAAITDFNRRAESGYFTSTAAFNAERATLVAQQHKLDALYVEINGLVDTTNVLIEQYNHNVARTEILVNSINSNAAETPEVE